MAFEPRKKRRRTTTKIHMWLENGGGGGGKQERQTGTHQQQHLFTFQVIEKAAGLLVGGDATYVSSWHDDAHVGEEESECRCPPVCVVVECWQRGNEAKETGAAAAASHWFARDQAESSFQKNWLALCSQNPLRQIGEIEQTNLCSFATTPVSLPHPSRTPFASMCS